MSRIDYEANLESRAALFKALGHPVRLLILNLLEQKSRHGDELATILKLKPATISHHMSKLSEAGLLSSEKDQYYQMYTLIRGPLKKPLAEVVFMPQPGLTREVEEDAYRKKVLRTFFKHGRLASIPAQLKKKKVVMEKIVEELEPDRTYTELEINQLLVEFHEDVATLRRSMVDFGLVSRKKGIYRRR